VRAFITLLALPVLLISISAIAARQPRPLPTVPHYEFPSPFLQTPTLQPPRYSARQDPYDPPEKQEKWHEAPWQWLIAFYRKTVDEPVAVFTLVLAASTILLWRVTDRSSNAARDAAEALPAIERPYVLVSGGGSLAINRQLTQTERPAVFHRTGNYGRTPAIIENVRAGFSRNNRCHPDMPSRVEETHQLLFTRTLKADQEFQYLWIFYPDDWTTANLWAEQGQIISPIREPDIPPGEELFLWVIINYRGAFTKGHETSICWKYSSTEHMFLSHGGDQYNYER
jgi:hypothetical protein